ncbi:Chitinase 2 [Basidiobolus ranarum]|uniref:chitinase n=1 Tax=Basidiobolus ranarum TaxID=34480 RepID=A0ABR2VRX4_9FUNG
MSTSRMKVLASILFSLAVTAAFQDNCNNNFVAYWGQNSYGVSTPDESKWEKSIRSYCEDDTVDVLNVAFLDIFNSGTNKLPEINLSFHCDSTVFPGTSLLSCPDIGDDIKYCQSKGKKVIMSLGGATGSYGFSNDADATTFSKTVWDLFLGGSSSTRPFGSAVLDGIDLDIEGGGTAGYAALISGLRGYFAQDTSKKYYITSAPQCPFPDAFLGTTLNTAWFDMVFVQFYNNYCSASNSAQFNFDTWHNWAVTQSANKNVKIFLGVPGSAKSASTGYIPAAQVNQVVQSIRSKYSSFGGVMVWDASTSDMNTDGGSSFAVQVKNELKSGGASCGNNPSTAVSPTTQSTAASQITKTTTSSLPSTSVITSTATQPTSTRQTTKATTSSLSSTRSTTTTSTRTSQLPSPTSNPNCPVQGGTCTSNAMGCNGYNFARCDNGKWVLSPCSTDKSLYCASGSSGVYCDWAAGQNVQSCSSNSALRKRVPDSSAVAKDALIDFVRGDATTTTEFTTLVRIRTTGKAFSNQWKVDFSLPTGQNVTSVTRGTFTQQGNLVTVLSEASKEPKYNMAILFEINGKQGASAGLRSSVKLLQPNAQFWDFHSS